MAELRGRLFHSHDNRFSVLMTEAAIASMVETCSTAGRKETGGILIGRLADRGALAIVLEATPKPRDSGFGWFWFRRGVKGLRHLLDERWSKGQHYLGEWHYHPGGSAQPSAPDHAAMSKIASDERYQCPEPILAILGGLRPSTWELSISVIPAREQPQMLLPARGLRSAASSERASIEHEA